MSSSTFDIEALLSKFPECSELADLLNLPSQGSRDLLEQSSPEILKLVLEYAKLAAIPHPLEQEANRIEEILAVANHINVLGFWIAEVDHLLGHHLDLLDEDNRESYQDQQALMRDYVGVMENFPVPRNKQIETYKCPIRRGLYPDDDLVHC